MMVMNCTFASGGSSAMWSTARAAWSTSIVGGASPGGAAFTAASSSGVRALPMSIWPQAIPNARPSSDSVRVRPVTACFVVV